MDLTNYPLAIVYNVFPHSPVSKQKTHQKSQQPDSHSAEGLKKAEHLNSFLQEHQKTSDCAEETHQQQPEGEQSSADGSSASPMISSSRQFSPLSPSASSVLSSISPFQQGEEGEGASSPQCTLVVADTQTGASLENLN